MTTQYVLYIFFKAHLCEYECIQKDYYLRSAKVILLNIYRQNDVPPRHQ